MPVDALDRHGAPVDQQLAVPHLDPPEAGDLADHLDHLAVRVPERDQDGVAIGLLGRPRPDAGDRRRERRPRGRGRSRARSTWGTAPASGRPTARPSSASSWASTVQPGSISSGRVNATVARTRRRAPSQVVGQAGVDADVAQVDGRPGLQVHLAVQAGHPPVVLVLQVAVGRPAHDHAGQDVLPRLQVGR